MAKNSEGFQTSTCTQLLSSLVKMQILTQQVCGALDMWLSHQALR